MPLVRCSDQKGQTLRDFYSDLANSNDQTSSTIGRSMLLVVEFIDQAFLVTKIYGLTSLAKLVLLPENASRADWVVSIISNGNEFHVEYLIPESKRPWPNAMVKGETKFFEEFKRMIFIAMLESSRWPDSPELKDFCKNN
jgi:hypothetical protein